MSAKRILFVVFLAAAILGSASAQVPPPDRLPIVNPNIFLFWVNDAWRQGLVRYFGPDFTLDAAGAMRPALQTVSIPVGAQAVTTLHSVPVTLVPAPGAGKFIQVVGIAASYSGGTANFGFYPGSDPKIRYGTGPTVALKEPSPISGVMSLNNSAMAAPGQTWDSNLSENATAQSNVVNQPLLFVQSADYGVWGAVTSSAKNAAGSGYAPNDTGTVTSGSDSGDAAYKVLTVGGGGSVSTYQLTAPGTSYTTASNVATQTGGGQPGSGSGFTLNVTVATMQTGSARIDVQYKIVTVP